MKLGDAVFYTTLQGRVLVGIVIAITVDGSVELCCLDALERKIKWYSRVKVTGAQAGTDEAREHWSPR